MPNDSHAPVLESDRQRAAQLWSQITGTELEHSYRAVSVRHPHKASSREHYRAFLDEIEALFVQPEALPVNSDADAPLWDEPAPVQAMSPTDVPAELAPVPQAEDAPEDAAEDVVTEGESGELEDSERDENGDGDEDGHTPAAASTPTALSPVTPPTGLPGTGLFSQLYGMLHDGGEVTVQVMRVGEQLTVGLFPKPVPGETEAPGVVVTQDAAWFDTHLVTAMQPYTQARVDAFNVFQQAAKRQQQSAKKAAEKPASSKPASAKNKTYTVTLQAAEGSTITGKQDGKAVDLKPGENEVRQGNLEITVAHPLFGEQQKTLAVFQDRGHDLREQQGGLVTVQVKPETAALSAMMGETTLALHGETLLPAGKWVIQAEAHGHKPKSVTVTVKAGKPQTVEMELEEDVTLF